VSLNGNSTIVYTTPSSTIQSTGAVTISGSNNLISLPGGYLNGSTNVLISGTGLSIAPGSTIAVTGPAVGNGTLSIGQSYTNPATILTLQTNATSIYLTASQNTSPLSQGLVAYYPLNGNAMDQSGNAYNGINVGGIPTTDRFGNSNSAFAFSGSTNGINQSKPNSPTVYDSFTIAFWFKSQTADQLATEQSWTTDYWYYGHYTIPGNNYVPGFCGIGIHAGTNGISVFEHGYQILTPILVYPKNFGADWNHAVVTIQNDGAPILYINGAKAHTGLNTGNLKLITPLHSGNLGTGIEQGLAGRYNGSLNDVRLYDRALSATEVGQLYSSESGDLDSDGDGLTDAYERGQGRYQVIQGNYTWDQAKADAESRTNANGIKGHLATITSEQEWAMARQLSSSYPNKDIWIGGTDDNNEGKWRWITGEPWAFTAWRSGEPNNSGDEPYAMFKIGRAHV
jgi:hypothetical protein